MHQYCFFLVGRPHRLKFPDNSLNQWYPRHRFPERPSYSASLGDVIPTHEFILNLIVSDVTSSTTAELMSTLQAFRYIQSQKSQRCTIISYSKSALQILVKVKRWHYFYHLLLNIQSLNETLLHPGHLIPFQRVHGHYGTLGSLSADAAARADHRKYPISCFRPQQNHT